MKQLIIFCVTLFVTHCILGVESSAIDLVEKFEKPNEDEYKTEFTDLDTDCLFTILERLSFSNLLNVARINDKYSALAADAYRRIYSHLPVDIGDTLGEFAKFSKELMELFNKAESIDADTFDGIYKDHPDVFYKDPKVEINKHLIINDYETMWNVFKHFGHEIKKIDVATLASEEREYVQRRALIGYLISKYCSNSLVDIKMGHVPDRLLEYITKPMINVQRVSLTYATDRTRLDLLQKVETIFPNVTKFIFSGTRRVENLNIELKRVTTFSTIRASVAPFHFPQLQTVHLGHYESEHFAEYHTFLNEHKHLSHLGFMLHFPTDSEFQELTANLKDLEEVTLEKLAGRAASKLSPKGVVEFLTSHENVKRLNVILFQNAWNNELKGRLNGWNMTTIDEGTQFEGLSFERQ